jgi:hypothetical protein
VDDLAGRAVVNLQPNAMPASGSGRDIWRNTEAQTLTDALVGMPGRVHLFSEGGGLQVFLDDGVHVLNAERLHRVIRENCVTKHLVTRGGKLEIEFRPVLASAMTLQDMLRKEGNEGGLRGRVPGVIVEAPRQQSQVAGPEPPPVETSSFPKTQIEMARGREVSQKYAATAERTRLEQQRGAELVARARARETAG